MASVKIMDLSLDQALDREALRKVLGGSNAASLQRGRASADNSAVTRSCWRRLVTASAGG